MTSARGPERSRVSALVDITAAAEMLGVTERMIRRLVQERRIESVLVGRHLRFRPEALVAFVEQSTRGPIR